MKLPSPLTFNEQTIDEITIDTAALTAGALIDAEVALRRELRAMGEILLDAENDPRYTLALIARATSLPVECLRLLPASTYTAVRQELEGFLFSVRVAELQARAE